MSTPTNEERSDHLEQGADAVTEMADLEGVRLAGADVVDVTAGTGAVALGLASRHGANVVAFDAWATDLGAVTRRACEQAGIGSLPANLQFARRNEEQVPTDDGRFDLAYSWCGLGRVRKPVSLLREVHRILKPQGLLLVRVDPLWVATGSDPMDPWRADGFGLDELQRTLLASGFAVTRADLRSHSVRLPRELARYRLSQLAVAGATIMAIAED